MHDDVSIIGIDIANIYIGVKYKCCNIQYQFITLSR